MPPFLRKLEGALANPVLNFLGLRRNSIVILKNNQFRSRLLFSSDFPLDNAIRNRITLLIGLQLFGEVLERLNRPVSKTGVGVTPPWVRIPPSPLSNPSLLRGWSTIRNRVPRSVPRKFPDDPGQSGRW